MAKKPYLRKMSEEDQTGMDRYFGEDRATTDIIFRFSRVDLAKFFTFLDELRSGGSINMLGAPPVLAEAFDLSDQDAKAIWSRWSGTFREGWEVEERVSRSMGWRGHEGFELHDWRREA